jgi:tRNA (guanine-N7-)-methyltransferase
MSLLPSLQIRQKSIRSFAVRAGRLTAGQERALQLGWPHIGLDLEEGVSAFSSAFDREAPRVLEIGYGMGHSLLQMAEAEPDKDFIGIEVHSPGVGSLIQGAYNSELDLPRLTNLKTYMADAVDVLKEAIPVASLSRIQIYFPDPWHKKRHHKRRLIQPALVKLLSSRLQAGGVLHLATDWEPYAQYMLDVLSAEPSLNNAVDGFASRPDWRPITKFEKRGEGLGHKVQDLVFERQS